MASMFSFGFSGDDIEDDVDAGVPDTTTHTDNDENKNLADNLPGIFAAEKHPIEEWVSFFHFHFLFFFFPPPFNVQL